MVRSIGVDPGDRAVKIVELDGSFRKTRLLYVHTAPLGLAGEDPMRPDIVAEAVREAIDAGGMKGDVTLGHPCREAVLRSLELPFKGVEAIRKVVKSEIEGEIYTHSVDDMVVDFHEIGAGASGGTRILVASVPKPGLRNQLTALAAQGVDPEVVDLDTMALWRAAHWAGAFDEPAADEHGESKVEGEGEVAPVGAPVHAVVDLGARSVKVILVEGEQLVEMRALRLGDAVVAEHIAREYTLPFDQARDAVGQSLGSGSDVDVTIAAELPAAIETSFSDDFGAEPAPAPEEPAPERAVVVSHASVEDAHTKYLQRLARELTRFLTASGMAPRIRSVWVSGGACRGQGVAEMLTAVFGREPRELDVFARLQHSLEPDEAAELGPSLVTAIGLALGRLGGKEGFQLRQEDLSLMRGFERVKFPLAIACMVALLALFVHANRRSLELKNLSLEIGEQFIDPKNPSAVIFHGLLNPIFSSRWFEDGQYFRLEGRKDYTYKDLVKDVTAAEVYDRIRLVRDKLRAVANQKQKQSGVYEDISLESGLAVLVRWAEVMKGVEPQLGRYLVPRIDLNMKGPNRRLEFTVAFRDNDFRSRMSALQRAIEVEYGKPDSPFQEPARAGDFVSETLFTDSDERGVVGAYFKVTISIKDAFEPFGPAGAR